MKAKHIPLLIAVATVAAAAWYFVTHTKKNRRTNTTITNTDTSTAPADNPTAQTPTTNANAWRKATPIVDAWLKEYVDTAKTNVEYKEQNGVLYVRGSICTKNYEGAGPNGIFVGETPLTYFHNTRQPQNFSPYFHAEEQDGDTAVGYIEFPSTMTFDAASADKHTPLTYANLQVVNAGEMSYFGQSVPNGQLVLDFVHHGDADGCTTFTFNKN